MAGETLLPPKTAITHWNFFAFLAKVAKQFSIIWDKLFFQNNIQRSPLSNFKKFYTPEVPLILSFGYKKCHFRLQPLKSNG